MCDASFKNKIRPACYDALEQEGFTRFRNEGMDWPLHDGFHCWVDSTVLHNLSFGNGKLEPSVFGIGHFFYRMRQVSVLTYS